MRLAHSLLAYALKWHGFMCCMVLYFDSIMVFVYPHRKLWLFVIQGGLITKMPCVDCRRETDISGNSS